MQSAISSGGGRSGAGLRDLPARRHHRHQCLDPLSPDAGIRADGRSADRSRSRLRPLGRILELYAGTANSADARAVDRIRLAAESLGRLYHPQAADLVLAGRVLSYWSRLHGRVRPRDHRQDLLIAIGAARSGGALLTANSRDMRRWATMIHRRGGLRVSVIVAA